MLRIIVALLIVLFLAPPAAAQTVLPKGSRQILPVPEWPAPDEMEVQGRNPMWLNCGELFIFQPDRQPKRLSFKVQLLPDDPPTLKPIDNPSVLVVFVAQDNLWSWEGGPNQEPEVTFLPGERASVRLSPWDLKKAGWCLRRLDR
jgi:hypothetical protein